PFVVPSYPGLRLWSDSISGVFKRRPPSSRVSHYNLKRRVAADLGRLRFSRSPAPLARIYILDPKTPENGDAAQWAIPEVFTYTGKAALLEVLKYVFHLDQIEIESL